MGIMGKGLAVSIPDTMLEERDSLREKTVKVGQVARTCSIYGVDVIEIYRSGGKGEADLIGGLLEYLDTPQYLRKAIYGMDERLQYAGLLPPLRIPSHKPKKAVIDVEVGEVREGVVRADGKIDVGLEVHPSTTARLPRGRRVTVRVKTVNPMTVEQISREETKTYWGYRVERKEVSQVFSDERFELKIATSRLGDPIGQRIGDLESALSKAKGMKLIFGSPTRGLIDIVGPDIRERVDYLVNMFVDQHVETVRTEEAIAAGLGLVNALMAREGLSAESKTGFEKRG